MTPILELRSVEKAFGDVRALERIDLEIQEGEFVSLLGPSGCGKTTTLRLIAGFESPTAGDVLIDGRSVVGQPADKRGVGVVFQNYALFPHMDVFDNIAFGLRAQGMRGSERSARVDEMVELMELGPLTRRRIHELSGGQQQRVALARALATKPRVLLLDEPLGALDKKLREQMQMVLMDLHRTTGMTMVYVTHDQEEALSMSANVAVMREGALVQYDSPAALYYQPSERYVCEFVGRTNVLPAVVERVEPDGLALSGSLRAPGEELSVGSSCVVCVRPEQFVVEPEGPVPPRDHNVLRGEVLERIFLGQTTTIVVAVDTGGRIEASCFSGKGETAAAPGERVTLSFDPDGAHVFPAPVLPTEPVPNPAELTEEAV